jgi:predicted metal-dependent phosphoesterase TrpH
MHGAEVFNGNPRHENNNTQAAAFARRHGLRQSAGSDFHQYEDVGRGGLYLPAAVATEGDLARWLKRETPRLYRNE